MDEDDAYEKLATPAEKKRWAKQNNMMYGGLIAISVVVPQGLLTASSLDTPSRISVIAFAIALPLLAVLILLGDLHASDTKSLSSWTYEVAKGVGLISALTGVVAAFWHLEWIAGVAILVAGVAALGVYTAHFSGSRYSQAVLQYQQQKASGASKNG